MSFWVQNCENLMKHKFEISMMGYLIFFLKILVNQLGIGVFAQEKHTSVSLKRFTKHGFDSKHKNKIKL